MAKLTLTDLANLQNEQTAVSAINANNAAIETALENTLSRDGTSPNTMTANLDMNNQRILNLPAPVNDSEPVRKSDLDAASGDLAALTAFVQDAEDAATAAEAAQAAAEAAQAAAEAAQAGAEAAASGTVPDNSVTNAKMADNAVGTPELQDDAVTNIELANMAEGRIKARISSGTGDPEDATITQVLDLAGSTNGDILVRSGGSWTRVAGGTAGKVLTGQGATTAPAYVGGMTLLNSGTASAALVTDITLPTGYTAYKLRLGPGFAPASSGVAIAMRFSYDGGSTFAATSYTWVNQFANTGAAGGTTGYYTNSDAGSFTSTAINLSPHTLQNSTSGTSSYDIDLIQGTASTNPVAFFRSFVLHSSGSYNGFCAGTGNHNTLDLIDAVRILMSSGNHNGPWYLYGIY